MSEENLSSWIGQQRRYKDVPAVVVRELKHRLKLSPASENLLPPDNLSIMNLLMYPIPSISGSLVFFSPSSWFFDDKPTHEISVTLGYPLPSKKLLNSLLDCVGQAMLDGRQSICIGSNPPARAIHVPFEVLTLWGRMIEAALAQAKWKKAMMWLDEVGGKRNAKDSVLKAKALVAKAQWRGRIQGLGSDLTFTEMADFLSREWLTGSHVDAMLRFASNRLSKDSKLSASHIITVSSLSQALSESPDLKADRQTYLRKVPKVVRSHGEQLEQSPTHTLWMVSHTPGHWTTTMISHNNREIKWGDSLNRPMPRNLGQSIKSWLNQHLPTTQYRLSREPLICATQNDSYSCGIIAVNTIKHHVFGDQLWTANDRETLRVCEFNTIMEYSLEYELQPLSELVSVDVDDEFEILEDRLPREQVQNDRPESGTNNANKSDAHLGPPNVGRLADYREPCLDGEMNNPASVMSPSNLVRLTSHSPHSKRKHSPSPVLEVGHKRPRKILAESNSTSKVFNGKGRSAIAKAALNAAVRDGTFKPNIKKWSNFVEKIKLLDANAEFDLKNKPRHVRHSLCGKWIVLSTVYDVSYFKGHLPRCKRDATLSNTPTLDTGMGMIQIVSRTQAETKDPKLPCTGLTKKDDPRIENYLKRTAVISAGADKSIHNIAAELYPGTPFNKLTQKRKDNVRLKQEQLHQWALFHKRGLVRAIGAKSCTGLMERFDGKDVPCHACRALLSHHPFQAAINKPIPEDRYRNFTPHLYQSAALGELYAKHAGLSELFENVC
ncbi:hypothetical protein E1B28_003935 [Marasmius oreades]|uniref:Ubiquitin-like protease family profile domain-containing protein n=1 Tax=Marasmius oreades TaxID=181124 RepID=A0A9P7UXL2_9AGAR|nr:uncharacterized protein E1B28_003935 [Marasmius oreades]KAG7096505.1 hypothetical protein E1B28_003935 [Marasmius oreades]